MNRREDEATGGIEWGRNAKDAGIGTLYKFMRYPRDADAPEFHAELRARVHRLLADGQIFFPTARQLNDPFEAAPHFAPVEGTPDEQFARYARYLRERHAPEVGLREREIEIAEQNIREKLASGGMAAHLLAVETKWRTILRTWPLQCFAGTRESTLMWSYYAEGHTGVCVHFDATIAPIGNAFEVHYQSEYPTVITPMSMEPEQVIGLALCTKSNVWRHEREFRLVNMPAFDRPGERRILDDSFRWLTSQLAELHPRYVVGVTVGASMQGGEIEQILRSARDRQVSIPVFQAKLQRKRFELMFERIS